MEGPGNGVPREHDGHGDELREEDVTVGDKLDDRVSEGEGLPADEGDDATN